MGILRLFTTLLHRLNRSPDDATNSDLDELVGSYGDFAYIGIRRRLKSVVLMQAERLALRLRGLKDENFRDLPSNLVQRLERCRRAQTPDEAAVAWYGRRDWSKDSALFPDFVLAMDKANTFGNGAILELKDSKDASIASFNSTIPTRFKSLEEVREIMGSDLVMEAVWLMDFPLSLAEDFSSRQRHCFYLVRTHRRSPEQVRISLVEGSFFETLSKDELLRRLWAQILDEIGVLEGQKEQLLPLLAQLKQTAIARSRHIEGASVKPRFRIMAEVEGEANPHNYPEVRGRTVNLIVKREAVYDLAWFVSAFKIEGLQVDLQQRGESAMLFVNEHFRLCLLSIWHQRNGEHWCLQWQMPSIAKSVR